MAEDHIHQRHCIVKSLLRQSVGCLRIIIETGVHIGLVVQLAQCPVKKPSAKGSIARKMAACACGSPARFAKVASSNKSFMFSWLTCAMFFF